MFIVFNITFCIENIVNYIWFVGFIIERKKLSISKETNMSLGHEFSVPSILGHSMFNCLIP